MNKIDTFRKYMLGGHGHCFAMLDEHKELYKETVLYGCLNNIAFDLQCEGSRSSFMYNLALQFDDYSYFLSAAIKKFMSPEVNDNWETVQHLTDFIELFAYNSDDEKAEQAIETKYSELYSLIMKLRWSSHTNKIIQSYEYIAIVVMQNNDFDRSVRIFSDMGAYFLRCRKTSDNDLSWRFEWFLYNVRKQYGEDFIAEKLAGLAEKSKELYRFIRVMSAERRFSKTDKPIITAEKYIEKAFAGKASLADMIQIRCTDEQEKIKLAQAAENEVDKNTKALLLKPFASRYNVFPLDSELLIKYTGSKNKKLRETAMETLLYVKCPESHDLAINQLKNGYSAVALEMLVNNYSDSDREFLTGFLNNITVDIENSSSWHGVVSAILDNAEIMPVEAIIFIFERSLCSCCRLNAVEELIKRNALTEEMISDCLVDCNEDIRKSVSGFLITHNDIA